MAYIGLDGDPRVIPIGFWIDGARIGMATVPTSAKVAALRTNPKVALTIDQGAFPPKVLLIRGTAEVRAQGRRGPHQEADSRLTEPGRTSIRR